MRQIFSCCLTYTYHDDTTFEKEELGAGLMASILDSGLSGTPDIFKQQINMITNKPVFPAVPSTTVPPGFIRPVMKTKIKDLLVIQK